MQKSEAGVKVCLIGAAGGIGQPLGLLLKLTTGISELALVDTATCSTPIKGVAADLSHINSVARVRGYVAPDDLDEALFGSSIVVITAGCMMLKPGMNRDSLFESSAGLISTIAQACARSCPTAFIAIVTNPVNSMVPIFAETMRKFGVESPEKRVFGVTTLDVVRASRFVSSNLGTDPKMTRVPVVGGHGGESIFALVSQTEPKHSFAEETIQALEKRIMNAAFEVVEAKNGSGSATLSMAYSAHRFCVSLIQAFTENVKDYAYVSLTGLNHISGLDIADQYFAGLCTVSRDGLVAMDPIPVDELTDYENNRLREAKVKCRIDVLKAFEYLNSH
jgi:malate dehydrogenase